MSDLIQFGKIETFTVVDDTTVMIQEENIYDFSPASSPRRFTRSIFADSTKSITAEALKLLDRLKDDDVDCISFEIKKRSTNKKYRVTTSWLIK